MRPWWFPVETPSGVLVNLTRNRTMYKQTEIREYFDDFIDASDPNWIVENLDDLHFHAFNVDYYIIGTWKASQWLGTHAFECIGVIRDYELDNFGEVSTDFSDPEKVVNMYVYIVGEGIVYEYLNRLEELA
jgi:hypothetical protein